MEKKGFFDRITRKTKKKVENHSPGTQQGRGVQKLNVYNTNGVQQQPLVVESEPPDAETTSGGRDLVKSVPTPGSITTKRDFWAEAGKKLGQLKPDVYQKLELAIQEGSNASGTLEERIRLDLSNKIAAITDRQWRIKWGARVNIPMRGLLEGVVKALEKFKDVGSAAASLDPVHAGLPLAAVCVLLPLILNLSSQEEPAKSGLDTISMIVARYAALESVYFQQDSIKLTKNFENTLVDLYAKILEYQAVAACFLGKRTLARYGSAIPKLDDFVGVLKEVQDLDEECIKLIQAIEAEAGRQSGRQLEKLFSLAEKVLAKLQSQCDMNEKIIDWLSDIEYGGDHDRARDTLGVSYAKSGEWLVKGACYVDWNENSASSSSIFWLRGPVGTGKTSLTFMVIQEHLEKLEASAQERVAYFYCSEKEQPPTTSLQVLRSLLAQISWNADGVTINDVVKSFYPSPRLKAGANRPDIEQCVDLIQILASACPKVTFIIDALDECADSWILLAKLELIHKASQSSISFFFSSRMHVDVTKYFPRCTTVGPEGNSADIESYIKTEMAIPHQRLLEGKHPELENRLAELLIDRAENMFRWVELELKLFLSPKYRMKYWKDVKSSLDVMESHVGKGVPQLNETYDTIYRMNTEGQPHAQALAQRVLKWVLLPLIPHDNPIQQQDASDMVKLDAVIEAISTDTDGIRDPDIDEKFISDICSNLIIFDESTQTLRFAHLSVVEYLQNRVTQNTTPPDNEFSFIHVRAEVAVSCLSWISHSAKSGASQISRDLYLQRPPIQRSYTTIGAVPTLATLQCSLLRFSVLYWHSYCPHTYYGPRENALQKLFSEVMYEERGSQILNFWIDQYKKSCGISLPRLRGHRWMRPGFMQCAPIEDWHMLMLTLSNCHVSDAQFVMRHPVKPGALYSTSGPPSRIFAAAAFGIQSVITCATNAELSEKNVFRQTNLQIAAARGHEKVLKELLECKSVREDINLFSPISDTFWDSGDTGEPVYGYVFRGTALHFAVLSSKDNPQIIKAIINAGADLEAKNDRGETARGMALRLGRWNAMKVLDDCTMNQGKASI